MWLKKTTQAAKLAGHPVHLRAFLGSYPKVGNGGNMGPTKTGWNGKSSTQKSAGWETGYVSFLEGLWFERDSSLIILEFRLRNFKWYMIHNYTPAARKNHRLNIDIGRIHVFGEFWILHTRRAKLQKPCRKKHRTFWWVRFKPKRSTWTPKDKKHPPYKIQDIESLNMLKITFRKKLQLPAIWEEKTFRWWWLQRKLQNSIHKSRA